MTIDEAINESKKELKEFFSDPKNQELLNQNKFQDLYKEYGYSLSFLTALFLKSNINFLPYMGYIPDCCFENLDIQSIAIPNNVEWIGDYAFSSCENLTNITIPNSVKEIGDSDFDDCEKLKSINYLGTKKE